LTVNIQIIQLNGPSHGKGKTTKPRLTFGNGATKFRQVILQSKHIMKKQLHLIMHRTIGLTGYIGPLTLVR